jgi:hypothetical protein
MLDAHKPSEQNYKKRKMRDEQQRLRQGLQRTLERDVDGVGLMQADVVVGGVAIWATVIECSQKPSTADHSPEERIRKAIDKSRDKRRRMGGVSSRVLLHGRNGQQDGVRGLIRRATQRSLVGRLRRQKQGPVLARNRWSTKMGISPWKLLTEATYRVTTTTGMGWNA